MTATFDKEFHKLALPEKIQLAESARDEVAAQGDELPVSDAHKRLLDARLAAHLKSPQSAITLNEFRRRLTRLL